MTDDGFSEDYRAGEYEPIYKPERRKIMAEKTVRISMKWTQCNTDPIQYKPLSPTLLPENVWIEVEIPDNPKYVVRVTDKDVILTPDGMALAMQNLAKAIRATYSESK
jgi:hypothetical protein